ALLRRGGTELLPADPFDERADTLGARLDSTSGLTRGGASLSAMAWELDEALDLFFAMLARPAFQPDRLASAQRNLRESMQRRNEDPRAILEREWEWLTFGERHFSTRPVTPASLAAIRRQDLLSFHQRYWRPQQLIFAVSGDFRPQEMLAALNRRLAAWPESPPENPLESRWPPSAPSSRARPGLYHVEEDVPQAKVALGHRAVETPGWLDPDRFVLQVVNEVLGGSGAISRVAGRLRTVEGLVYRASARYELGDLWPGDFQIFFATESRNSGRAVALALEELQRLRSRSVHPKELEVAKRTLLGNLRLAFDTAEEIAGTFAEDELLGRPHAYWEAYREGIQRVSREDVLRVARTHILPEDFVFLVVGRWQEISGGAEPGASALERATGHRVTHLPNRDPLTLRPLTGSD
ncbi:MAG: pitrilysin family protein, partial [Thermoanaerobaculia bacterium]